LPDTRLDFSVAASMAVAPGALQSADRTVEEQAKHA
jgi:hypothetical protein